ncbi:MAG: carboxylating nicotinate-nucleotide diphosphorylase [Rhodospirillales bacterium]|jgi:nicotinate-nucleotide pyrophosphorylase (carboxylating)|nr:carboxylating nicotinate-nucleotide diphosphorylase [Rhodospirillales bacterium]MDP6574749.1 carboxylating nicotinate-nucleotide diphosphorylase [Rhodospirillales bacterium]MDP6774214.1 carboxylating nicotinate-nucleotide diphosphorylase [Rhodospirillales bacterium]HJO73530.1 carboxylating nicotinate-nucleotide diphosphorylase [Rhodospirillales bacterium]
MEDMSLDLIPSVIRPIIEWGIREELGHGDHTGAFLAKPNQIATGKTYIKKEGVVCGLPLAKMYWEMLEPDCEIEVLAEDGDECEPGQVLMVITASTKVLSAGERLALDYLQHLSGIATKTRRFVELAEPFGVTIADARKGIPPIRLLQKYAVRKGGARSAWYSLSNAILIKDNHIKMAGGLTEAIELVRARGPHTLRLECECETLDQVREALDAGVDAMVLDNMEVDMLRQAVDIIGDKAFKEASGGVTEDMVVPICETGIDQIAVGGLTNSVEALDISIDLYDMKESTKRTIDRARAKLSSVG